MLHLYAVVAAGSELPAGLAGLDGASLCSVAAAGLAGVASEHEQPELPATEERILRHAAVVDALAAAAPAVLPARFGDAFLDAAALERRLRERADDLRAGLDAVRGRAELGLRVVARDAEGEEAPTSGRAYMDRRLRRVREARAVHEPLARLADRSDAGPGGTGAALLKASYLVRRDRVDAFRREVERLQDEHPALALVCTGPWPPYSFVPDGEDAS